MLDGHRTTERASVLDEPSNETTLEDVPKVSLTTPCILGSEDSSQDWLDYNPKEKLNATQLGQETTQFFKEVDPSVHPEVSSQTQKRKQSKQSEKFRVKTVQEKRAEEQQNFDKVTTEPS